MITKITILGKKEEWGWNEEGGRREMINRRAERREAKWNREESASDVL